MKKSLLIAVLFTVAIVNNIFSQDNPKSQPSLLLAAYYNIKDALVSGNPVVAASSAEAYITALNSIGKETIKEESRNALLSDAHAISKTKDLKLQREKFAGLSSNMYALAKTVKLSTEPIYQQYCPMKKASWLSNNKAIKNPYYGSAMLTCGSVKESL